MKRVLFLCLVLTSASLSAQVEKGKYFVGGAADISGSYTGKNSTFNMSLSPQFAVFVVNGFAIGGRYSFGVGSTHNYDFSKHEYVNTTTFSSGIGPVVRYYIGKKPLKGLVSANANYLTTTTLRKSSVSGNTGFNAMGLVGIAYFFNEHIGLEAGLYYQGTWMAKLLTTSRMGFSVGFSVFLNNKKKEKPLMNDSKDFKQPE